MAHMRQQALIGINDGPIYRCIDVSLGLNKWNWFPNLNIFIDKNVIQIIICKVCAILFRSKHANYTYTIVYLTEPV